MRKQAHITQKIKTVETQNDTRKHLKKFWI